MKRVCLVPELNRGSRKSGVCCDVPERWRWVDVVPHYRCTRNLMG